ncbi:hypothetical protein GCM10012319_40490 [Comamonas sp. KCTC 72670]|nr:hypothetical protein GCM10012319_40490 [Comamonas sp. KCTC 72670]
MREIQDAGAAQGLSLRQRSARNIFFDELHNLQHALRSGLGNFHARPQVGLNLFGSPRSPTHSAGA